MGKMQVRLTREQVTLICDGLESSEFVATAHAQRERTLQLIAWLRWRAAKLWGTSSSSELDCEQAS